jgi:hypothetical protein
VALGGGRPEVVIVGFALLNALAIGALAATAARFWGLLYGERWRESGFCASRSDARGRRGRSGDPRSGRTARRVVPVLVPLYALASSGVVQLVDLMPSESLGVPRCPSGRPRSASSSRSEAAT